MHIPAGFEWTFTKRPTAYPSFRTQNVHMPAGFEWTFTKRPPAYPNFRTQNYMYSCRFWMDIHQTSPSVPHSKLREYLNVLSGHSPNVPQRPPLTKRPPASPTHQTSPNVPQLSERLSAYPTQNYSIPAGFEWTITKRPTAYPNFRTQNYVNSCRFWVDIQQTSPSVPHSPNVPQRTPTYSTSFSVPHSKPAGICMFWVDIHQTSYSVPQLPNSKRAYSCRFWVDIHQTSPSVPHSTNVFHNMQHELTQGYAVRPWDEIRKILVDVIALFSDGLAEFIQVFSHLVVLLMVDAVTLFM